MNICDVLSMLILEDVDKGSEGDKDIDILIDARKL